MHNGGTPARRRVPKLAWLAVVLLAIVLLLAIGLRHVLQPQVASRLLLDQLGRTLGLRITATGAAQYAIRGTPTLVIRDVVVQQPGAAEPLLRADRILVSMTWAGIRGLRSSTTGTIDMQRLELDRPQLQLPALRRWLASRPPGPTRIPVLSRGLRIRNGRIAGDGWSLDRITADAPALVRLERFEGHVGGRYVTKDLSAPFDLRIVMTSLARDSAVGVAGPVALVFNDSRLDAHIVLSGRLRAAAADWRFDRAKLAATARYTSGNTRLPFVTGIAGTVRSQASTILFAPLGIVVHGTGSIPDASARGDAAFARLLVLHLNGMLPTWPSAWPGLPTPLDDPREPIAFALHYRGNTSLSDAMALQLRKGPATFDGTLRPLVMGDWIGQASTGNPLPPLNGRIAMPALEIAGTKLQGVDMSIDDGDDVAPAP